MESYYKYNGIYTYTDFTRELYGKGQVIRQSVLRGHDHSRVTDNEIKKVVRIAITIMINYALSWIDTIKKNLWPMSM